MALAVSVKIQGIGKLRKQLGKAVDTHRSAVVAAIYQDAQALADEALRLTPKDTGRLRRSRGVTVPRVSSQRPTSVVAYDTPYAIFVHEIDKNYRVGQFQFLRQPFNRRRGGWEARVAKKARRNITTKTTISKVARRHPTKAEDRG